MLVGGGRFHEELGNLDLALSFPKDSEQARGNGFTASQTPDPKKTTRTTASGTLGVYTVAHVGFLVTQTPSESRFLATVPKHPLMELALKDLPLGLQLPK